MISGVIFAPIYCFCLLFAVMSVSIFSLIGLLLVSRILGSERLVGRETDDAAALDLALDHVVEDFVDVLVKRHYLSIAAIASR